MAKQSKVKNLGDIRKMSDMDLVEALFDDLGSGANYRKVLLERMKRDGYTEFFDWVWETREELKTKPEHKPAPVEDDNLEDNIIPVSRSNETLRRELTAILRSSYNFTSVRQSKRCREFCSDRGNVLDLKESQLSYPQKRMLGLIRDRADTFLRGRS